jgi:hypothetical protein
MMSDIIARNVLSIEAPDDETRNMLSSQGTME